MSEKKTATNVAPETVATVTTEKPAARKAPADLLTCFRDAIKSEKSFKLFRSLYNKNGKTYSAYSVFLILPGSRQKYREVQLLPDIGFVQNDESGKRIGRNSSGYQLLSWMYESGAGLKLKARIHEPRKNEVVVKPTLDFYAYAEDESGMCAESDLVPRTPAEKGFLECAFVGFGSCRDMNWDDLSKIEKLSDEFGSGRIVMPGQDPGVDIEDPE